MAVMLSSKSESTNTHNDKPAMSDYFDQCGSKIKKQNPEQTTIKSTNNAGINTAYGHLAILSTSTGIYKWSLKIARGGRGVLVVGISSTLDLENAFYKNTTGPNYGYNLYSGYKVKMGKFTSYGIRAVQDDIITTILNLNNGTISYKLNGNDQKVAHKVERKDSIKYRFCISMQDNDDTVTMTKFEADCIQNEEKEEEEESKMEFEPNTTPNADGHGPKRNRIELISGANMVNMYIIIILNPLSVFIDI